LATVKQAAIVGGMDSYDLLNKLRTAVGQEPLKNIKKDDKDTDITIPQWAKNPANISLNANEILNNNKNPLAETSKMLKKLKKDEILEIISDFKPEPLIKEFQKQGFEVSSYKDDSGNFITKIISL
jgi:TusA-related sulfurtransferase